MVLNEVACEAVASCGDCYTCNNDQMSFKAYFVRWAAVSTKWVSLADIYFFPTPYNDANELPFALTGTLAVRVGPAVLRGYSESGRPDVQSG